MIITLENEVLADNGYERHGGLKINGRPILQEAEFLRAESIEVFNRKNQRTALTFQTHKLFTDQADADVWMLERFPLLLSLCGLLKLTATSESKEVNRYIRKAAVANLTAGEIGVSIELNWEIHGGKIITG